MHYRRRAAEQVREHEVRPDTLRDVEDLRAHLHPGRRHGEGAQLEALVLLQLLQDRQRLDARRIVVIEIGDLLALQAAAQLFLDELDAGSALRPVGRGQRKQVRILAPFAAAAEPKPGDVPGIWSFSSRGFSASACGVPQISVDTMPSCL